MVSEPSLQIIEDKIKIFLSINEDEMKEMLINFAGQENSKEEEVGQIRAV